MLLGYSRVYRLRDGRKAFDQDKLHLGSINPLPEHTARNVKFDTDQLIKAYTAAFDASKTNPADRLAFVDFLVDVRADFELPYPFPGTPKGEAGSESGRRAAAFVRSNTEH